MDESTPDTKKIARAQMLERMREARAACKRQRSRAKKDADQVKRFAIDMREFAVAIELARSLTARVEILNAQLQGQIQSMEAAIVRIQAERKLWEEREQRNAG